MTMKRWIQLAGAWLVLCAVVGVLQRRPQAGPFLPCVGGNDGATVFLFHGWGANAGTTFKDSSFKAVSNGSVGAGSPTTSTTQAKFGPTSLSASSAFITFANQSYYSFGTGPFTIDFQIFPTAALGTASPVALWQSSGGTNRAWSVNASSGTLLWDLFYTTNRTLGGVATIAQNVWTHIAVERNGSSNQAYVNGALDGSAVVDGTTMNASAVPLGIGNEEDGLAGNFTGFIAEVRISNVARYGGAAFTPPQAPYCGA